MPTYEYICEECEKTEECFQSIGEPPPVCHEKSMKRLISGAPHIRKGGGAFSFDVDVPKMGDYKE